MPSYAALVLSIFFELIAIMIITVGFFVVIEKLKQTESRMYSAESEVIRLNRLIVILVTPKPKNSPIVKEIQQIIEGLKAAELQEFNNLRIRIKNSTKGT